MIIDISPPLTADLGVWPGDIPLSRTVAMDTAAGHHLTLSSLTTTVHLGAHADAPSHFRAMAATIDQLDLQAFIGPCRVVSAVKEAGTGGRPLITPADLAPALANNPPPRLLVRTLSQPNLGVVPEDFAAFAPETIDLLGRLGVVLVGIDTPSVDPFDSKELLAHHRLSQWNIRNLEGLDLRQVRDGDYELIALPLRLVGFDASPVRAVLRALI